MPMNPPPPPPPGSASSAPAGPSYFPLPFHLQQHQPQPQMPPPMAASSYQQYQQQLHQAHQLFQRDAQTITPEALQSVKTKGYGFVSFSNPTDLAAAIKEMNGKYVGNRPIKLRKSNWKERTDVEALQRQKNHVQRKPKIPKKSVLHK
ncbi:RNA-binding (RRM/RBD/RNP motifs) family protein [Zea mays]|uniref:RNA-binding (RRM/RBD/RNP motifs) family protein n=1 Tax=Zea mays TaxID=4577 RepID=A0A1D6F0H6_MAIZE|nr:RNA-binding (RRM/RBD/RNP motifs) family protein [Zea mays]